MHEWSVAIRWSCRWWRSEMDVIRMMHEGDDVELMSTVAKWMSSG